MEKMLNCCLNNIDQMQSFYLCISILDTTVTCTIQTDLCLLRWVLVNFREMFLETTLLR